MRLVLFIIHKSGTRADVTNEANADLPSGLLYRFCICLSKNPNKPYSSSMQAVTKL